MRRSATIIGIGMLAASAHAEVPAPLRALYQASNLDPNNPCLIGAVPRTPMEHADREKCMLHEFISHGGPAAEKQPYLRNYTNGAKEMEEKATRAEARYQSATKQ